MTPPDHTEQPSSAPVSHTLDWTAGYAHPSAWAQDFPPLSVPDMLFATASARGAMPFCDFMGRRTSYAELARDVRRAARGLQDLGFARGDRIALFLPNVPHYPVVYYGAMAAGLIVVNCSPLYSADELAHQLADAGARALVTVSAAALLPTALTLLDRGALDRMIVGSVAEALPPVKRLAFKLFKRSQTAAIPADPRITPYADLLANNGDYTPAAIDPQQDVALLQYTGGTTGVPKGAMLTHQNLTANARQVNAIDPDRDRLDRILGVLPFFHVFANTCVLNRTVANGGEVVMLPRFDARDALAAINRTRVTAMPGVPTMYQALLDHPAIAKTDFTSLRVCISGGAPLSGELKARFEERTGARLVEGYGLTESSGVVSTNPYEGLSKTGTIGQPLPATRIRLLDKEDPSRLAPPGEPGELAFAGPQVMKGYWNQQGANADLIADGFLRTGDVASVDADGYLKIVDRIKDMIAVGGFKVFPSQVEAVLYAHPAVKEALVIGVADAYRGESPQAWVALNADEIASGEVLRDWANVRLGKHERLTAVTIVDALPKTMIGKLDRKALRQMVAAQRA